MPSKKSPRRKAAAKSKPRSSAKKARPKSKSQQPAREIFHTVTPQLTCEGAAEAIEFYKQAFGATEETRMPNSEGKLLHSIIRIGDSAVMVTDEFPEAGSRGPRKLQGSPVTLHLNVPDVDAFVARAVKAGAKVTMPVTDMFWGDRYGQFEDPFGHQWSAATPQRKVSQAEMAAAAKQM